MSDDPPRTTAAAILGAARAAMTTKRPQKPSPRRRQYPVLEALTGEVLPPHVEEPVPAFRGEPITKQTALVRADQTKRTVAPGKETKAKQLAARMVQKTKGLTAHQKFQQLIEKTVKTLLMTASPEGDLAFRADVDASVMNDLSLDVMLSPQGLDIAFYTADVNIRRLLQGYERDLLAHLHSRGLKVHRIRYQEAPDEDEPPPVPIT